MTLDPSLYVEVEYFCPSCNVNFCVYHKDDSTNRNTHCCWCNSEVQLTGCLSKFEGDDVVTYKDGKEIARRKQCGKK
jgi:hypothetical protein